MNEDADATLALLADLTAAADPRLRELARRLAAQVFVDLAARGPTRARGTGRMATVPYRPDRGDLDLDRSSDAIVVAHATSSAVDPEHLGVRAWTTPHTAWCLLVDRSGSMGGRPLAAAGLAAATIAGSAATGHVSVLSFAQRVIAVTTLAEQHPVEEVIDRVLTLRGHGTTDVAAALRAAGAQLAGSRARRRITVLLSDCRATEPGDVVAAARALDELVIIAPRDDSDDAALLADAAGARWTTVSGPSDVAAAFDEVLTR
ncbi:MAG: VWA domain-containing protein [Actinobacteria bacterium]|nr:VWA domain-containing protein [Actinomycetota bacterium]